MLAGSPLATVPLAWTPSVGPAPPAGPTTLRGAVRKLLRDDPEVFAVVGERIRFAGSKQVDPEPRITYLVSSRTHGRDLDGPDDTSEARVRVSSWASNSVDAEDLAIKVRMAVDGFSGLVGEVYIASVDHLVDVDLPEWLGDGGDDSVHQIATDFIFDHRAPYPARGV